MTATTIRTIIRIMLLSALSCQLPQKTLSFTICSRRNTILRLGRNNVNVNHHEYHTGMNHRHDMVRGGLCSTIQRWGLCKSASTSIGGRIISSSSTGSIRSRGLTSLKSSSGNNIRGSKKDIK